MCENALDAVYVFDHSHIVKPINADMDKVCERIVKDKRKKEMAQKSLEPSDVNLYIGYPKSHIAKGTMYILLRSDNTKEDNSEHLNAALQLNSDFSRAYYLKEESKLIWMYGDTA